jgi:hypothetical protein
MQTRSFRTLNHWRQWEGFTAEQRVAVGRGFRDGVRREPWMEFLEATLHGLRAIGENQVRWKRSRGASMEVLEIALHFACDVVRLFSGPFGLISIKQQPRGVAVRLGSEPMPS